MPELKEKLWRTLLALKEEEFQTFKWFLELDDTLQGFSGIPVAQLEKAKRQDTVNLMVQRYQGPGALKRTIWILERMGRNDLQQRLHNLTSSQLRVKDSLFGLCVFVLCLYFLIINSCTEKWALYQFFSPCTNDSNPLLNYHQPLDFKPDVGDPKGDPERTRTEKKSDQQFAVETPDPEPAKPRLFLPGDVKEKLPENPKRFYSCVSILGEQRSFSGKCYHEVQVKGKTVCTVAFTKERTGNIPLRPEEGLWIICWDREDVDMTVDEPLVSLTLKSHPQRVLMSVDYKDAEVSFYNQDTEDRIYSLYKCSFTKKLHPIFCPDLSAGGRYSSHHGDVKEKLPDNPKRFYSCVTILGEQRSPSRESCHEVQVKEKTVLNVVFTKASTETRWGIPLHPEEGFWTLCWDSEDVDMTLDYEYFVGLFLKSHPQVFMFVDCMGGEVNFCYLYEDDDTDLLYSSTNCSSTEKHYPFFSPDLSDNGRNSAPLIISPVNQSLKPKTTRWSIIQQFAVEVTLNPDTAHPNLILSDDGKQVHYSDVTQNLPDNPERFNGSLSVLGKQSFSSGIFYYEVQVKNKTDWSVGVVRESVDRKGRIPVGPGNGFWTIGFGLEDLYIALNDPVDFFFPKSHPQKVRVFVDYEEGLVSFYDADTADLLYSFTGCDFTEKLYPYFRPW